MQVIKSYFENKNPRIRAQIVGFTSDGSYSEAFMYSNPIKIYSGVNNPIRIQCLNSDQKRINISNIDVQVSMYVPNTEQQLLIQTATNVDTANGLADIIFVSSDLADFPFGQYELAVTATDTNGNIFPVYIDDNYKTRLTVDLMKGPVQGNLPPMVLNFLDISEVGIVSNQVDLTHRPLNSTVATLSANLQSYTGNIVAQASLTSNPPSNGWGNVSFTNYSNVSGYVSQSLIGTYATCRFLLDSGDPHGWGNLTANTFITNGNIRI